jgi:hypothetical protein
MRFNSKNSENLCSILQKLLKCGSGRILRFQELI